MALLASIVHATGALLVLSSTWRKEAAKVSLLNEVLRRRSLPTIEECTKVLDEPRAAEICEWLDRHPNVSRWIAIDDMDLLGALVRPKQLAQASRLRGHIVRTRCEEGLTQTEADLALRLLRRPNGMGPTAQRVSAKTSPLLRMCVPTPSFSPARSISPGCRSVASAQTDLIVRTRGPSPARDPLLRTLQRGPSPPRDPLPRTRGPSPPRDPLLRTRGASPWPDTLLRTREHCPHADPLLRSRQSLREHCPHADPLLHFRQSLRATSPQRDRMVPTRIRESSNRQDSLLRTRGTSPRADPLLVRPQQQATSFLGLANPRQTHSLLPDVATLRSASYMTLETAQAGVPTPQVRLRNLTPEAAATSQVRAQSPHFQRQRQKTHVHAGCSLEASPMLSKTAPHQPIRASSGILVLA